MSSYHIDVLLTHPWYHSAITRIKQEATIKEETAIAVVEQPERDKKADSELDPHSLVDSINKKHAAILLDKVVAKLIGTQFLTDTFSFGGTKYTGVCCLSKEGSLHRRITMRLMPQDEYVCALFFMTGSFDFGKEMRRIAMRRGFMLNEYCLRRIHRSGRLGSPIRVTCEQDIFEALGQDYKPPEERNL
jgi:DNA polymerase/3'-5' exonuclease PolX